MSVVFRYIGRVGYIFFRLRPESLNLLRILWEAAFVGYKTMLNASFRSSSIYGLGIYPIKPYFL